MKNEDVRFFPIFVDMTGRKILVVGAGVIAARRVTTLLKFGTDITVIAPRVSETIHELARKGKLILKEREYADIDLVDFSFVLASTDDKELNERIYTACKEKGIPVNVCDRKELCDFQFPSVVLKEDITVGINASGRNHRHVKAARKAIERCLQGEEIYE